MRHRRTWLIIRKTPLDAQGIAMARPFHAPIVLAAALAGLCVGFAGCSSRTNVSAIGNTPATYSHVYITAQEVWFNNSATAGPDDGGWVKFPLSTPATVDLVADSGGNFGNLVTDLKLAPGSYSQIRLIPVDASVPLTISAQTLGAAYNMEADYIDGNGNSQQVPLEVLNPDKGIGVQASLTVPIGNVGAAVGAGLAGAGTGTGTTTDGSLTGSTGLTGTTDSGETGFGTTTGTTGTTGTTPTTTTGLPTTTAEFSLSINGTTDLMPFSYGTPCATTTSATPCATLASGILLSSHASAYDLSQSGGIQGQLTLTNLTGITGVSGLPAIQVAAEALTADGTRHFVVASAPVSSDGTFTLYPLAANSSNSTVSYDLVIHGQGIATIVIKDVQIPAVNSSSNPNDTTTTGTTGTTTAATTTNPDTTPITPTNLVSVGTLIPRAVGTYTANVKTAANAPLPAGAEVAFYQTISASGEVPYVIEESPIDPFNQVLDNPQTLSAGTIDSGTFVSSGATVTVVSAAPHEGTGTYQVAATAPLYADGMLGIPVSPPPASSTTSTTSTTPPPPQEVTVTALSLASGGSPASISAGITQASAGKYDHGELLVSHNGQLIASQPLDAALTGGGSVILNGLPGGTSGSLYYLSVRVWKSSNPAGTLARQWYPTAVDLRSASSASVQLSIN